MKLIVKRGRRKMGIMLRGGSQLSSDEMAAEGTDTDSGVKLIQVGWEAITEALKQGGISLMMERIRLLLSAES